jgi:hypothetical protein
MGVRITITGMVVTEIIIGFCLSIRSVIADLTVPVAVILRGTAVGLTLRGQISFSAALHLIVERSTGGGDT